jgi:type IV pilus assembly protein PilA
MKNTKHRAQGGFTLIELMIVVAVIAILAALAVPQYQNYVSRTKWQDNMAKVDSTKLAVAECLQQSNGAVASCDTTAELIAAVGYQGLPSANTGYLASVALTLDTAAIVVTGNSAVGSCVVSLTPTVTSNAVTWSAVTAASPAGCDKSKTGY